MKKPQIVVIGSSNTDMVIRVPHLPRPGETLLGGKFFRSAGGKGANQAVAAARAGGHVKFVARVGRDNIGDEAVRGFVRNGIDVRFVKRDPASHSGVALIFVADNAENSIAVAGGANGRLSPNDIRGAAKAIAAADVVLMQLETPLATIKAAAAHAWNHGVPVILNPAPARALPDSLLRKVSLLTPNETEAELLTGIAVRHERDASRAARRLIAKGVGAVVITLGARGAWIEDVSGGRLISSFKVKAVDTTAAGDVFNGVLAVGLAEGRSLIEAVGVANAAAAVSVTKAGAQASAPTRRIFMKLFSRRVQLNLP